MPTALSCALLGALQKAELCKTRDDDVTTVEKSCVAKAKKRK